MGVQYAAVDVIGGKKSVREDGVHLLTQVKLLIAIVRALEIQAFRGNYVKQQP